MTVTMEMYNAEKMAFIRKHHGTWSVATSPMDEYGCYHKEYVFSDDAIWYEVMGPAYVTQQIPVMMGDIKITEETVTTKLFRTEFWNSDDATSKYCYEKF